ncbi:MAG: MbcA/ParS/Xre antitoxin family protein [Waterburya sp.]
MSVANQFTDEYSNQIINKVTQITQDLSSDAKKHLSERLENLAVKSGSNSSQQAVGDAIAGKTYSPEEKKELALLNLMNSFSQRAKLLEDTIGTSEVAKLLSCRSRQTPLDRRENKTLLAVKDNGQWKYPLWQFDPEGDDGIVNGLSATLQALNVSDLAKVSWLTRPNPIFDNLTPLEMLKRGEVERVVNEAVGVGLPQ